jgi:hypothetical protein
MAASSSLGRLTIDLVAKVGGFTQGMDAAARHSQKRMREIEREAKMLGKAIAGALTAAATVVSVQVARTINEMDRIAKSSQAIGVTVEQLSSLEFAAKLAGVSNDSLASSLQRLSRGMSDAARGTGTAKTAFESLNVQFQNTDGTLRDTEQVIKDVADRFAGMEDGAQKTALAMELFGRSGAQLIPLLNQGADGINALQLEAAQLGLVMSTQTARAAEQFNDDLTRLNSVMTGVWREMTASLLPALVTFTGLLVDAQRESDGFGVEFDAMTDKVVRSVAFIVDAMDGLQRVFKIVGRGGAVAFIALRQEALRFADGIINGPTRAINALIELYNRIPGININARAPDMSGAIARELEMTKRMLREGLADIDAILMEPMAGDAIRARFEQVRVEMDNLPARARVIAPELEEAIGGGVERGTTRASTAISTLDRDLDQLMQEGRRVFEQTRMPAEKLGMEIERLNRLLDAGAIDWDTYSRAIFAAQDQFDQYRKATTEGMEKVSQDTKKATDQMSQFSIQAARSMQSAFADFLFDPFDKGVKGMLQEFLRVLQRMAAEAAAARIFESLGGIFGGAAGGGIGAVIGGGLGKIVSGIGGVAKKIFGGLFADGGVTQPGKAYVVGERGPELFVPGQTGTVVPNHQMGGGANVRIINVIDPNLVADYLNSPGGDQAIVNVLQRNSGTVRQILA